MSENMNETPISDWEKIVLWRLANGWLITPSGTIWESHIDKYYIVSDLHGFTKLLKKPKQKMPKRDKTGRFLKAA